MLCPELCSRVDGCSCDMLSVLRPPAAAAAALEQASGCGGRLGFVTERTATQTGGRGGLCAALRHTHTHTQTPPPKTQEGLMARLLGPYAPERCFGLD